ncbi:hypothetical protein [Acidovorax sp. 1608163]|uniref:hypothetical protein n=1 Tax=Acidovorax sp. 1608163 TaxID=2478662 RepID=UPI00352B21A5
MVVYFVVHGMHFRALYEVTPPLGRSQVAVQKQADRGGRAHWETHYLFSATGRKVHNIIDGTITFTPNDLIATYRDHFSFWRWSS